ncbi:amino acid permease [Paenibacillus sp. P26]|nr:amino acid permease [Paenibacillus sp. P26]
MHDRHRFFLGSGLAIRIGGPSALISFILAALVTLIVFDVLAKMTSEDPLEGSFRSYAKKAFGRWAGFSGGYVYWSAELLIMGSQLTALSLFSRHWFPQMPMWIFASGYAVLGLTVIVIGTRAFERVENLFAVIKIAAILMFIAIAALALAGIIPGHAGRLRLQDAFSPFVPDGFRGWWSSLLFAFYAFGGIEIMGLMALRLSKPEEAPKAGRMMLLLIAVIYVVSLFLAMLLVPWETFHSKKSPFMMALGPYRLPWVPDLFNAVLIIAGFSTMVASLFAVTQILVTLSNDGDAPAFFSRKWKNRPLAAIGLTTAGLAASIVLALLMPGQVYEYFTTAAGLMLIYNWCFILVTAGKAAEAVRLGHVEALRRDRRSARRRQRGALSRHEPPGFLYQPALCSGDRSGNAPRALPSEGAGSRAGPAGSRSPLFTRRGAGTLQVQNRRQNRLATTRRGWK